MLPVTILLIGACGWGLMWIPLKYFNGLGLDGVVVTFISYGVVTLALLPVMLKERAQWRSSPRATLGIILLGGYANLAFTLSLIYGDVVRVMVLFYLLPAWGVLGGKIFLGEHVDRWRFGAVVLSVVGAVLVLGGFAVFQAPPSWIDLLALSAGFALAMNNIVFRATPMLPIVTKTGAMLLGCSMLAGFTILFSELALPEAGTISLGQLALFGFCWIMVSAFCTQWAVTKMEAGRASVILIMELLAAVVSAMIIGGESLSLLESVGGLLIIAAALIEARRISGADAVPV